MAVVRHLVQHVDEALPLYRARGFKLADRWGPPLAVMKGHGLSLWLRGPATFARRKTKSGQSPEPGGWGRLVIPVRSMDETVAKLEQRGVRFRSRPIKGPGGQQAQIEDPSGCPMETLQPRDPE
jgi:catechol 2,3-dioxygenase-like lactoylglutathione lyase family enzyme